MKTKTILFINLVILLLSLTGCIPKKEQVKVEEFFSGPHDIRKMVNVAGNESNLSARFFIFSGSITANSSTQIVASFSWRSKNGEWIITTMDVEKIKVKFKPGVENPLIYFKPRDLRCGCGGHVVYLPVDFDSPIVINQLIEYATIECKEEDWKVDISMPLENIR